MQPTVLDPAGWAFIGALITKLTVFVVLMVLGAFAFLLGRAVLPSLVATHQIPTEYLWYRRVLIPTGLVAFALAVVQLARVVVDLVAVLQVFYPRWGF